MDDFPEDRKSPCCDAEAWDQECDKCSGAGDDEYGNECDECYGAGHIEGWCECSVCGDTFQDQY